MNNIIILITFILLFITSGTVTISTFSSSDSNYTVKDNTIENEQTLKKLSYYNDIQLETKNLCPCKITKIYNINFKKKNVDGIIYIPEPNTIILGGIGTIIVFWMRRSRLL